MDVYIGLGGIGCRILAKAQEKLEKDGAVCLFLNDEPLEGFDDDEKALSRFVDEIINDVPLEETIVHSEASPFLYIYDNADQQVDFNGETTHDMLVRFVRSKTASYFYDAARYFYDGKAINFKVVSTSFGKYGAGLINDSTVISLPAECGCKNYTVELFIFSHLCFQRIGVSNIYTAWEHATNELLRSCKQRMEQDDVWRDKVNIHFFAEKLQRHNIIADISNPSVLAQIVTMDEKTRKALYEEDFTQYSSNEQSNEILIKRGISQSEELLHEQIKPYEGDKPFVFVSYPHQAKNDALPIIEELIKKKFHVWYDEGVDPGTEWPEIIAKHIENCSYFIACISPEYIESDNCKDELNYARDLNKKRLLVYLAPTELPGGMKMRLNRLQAIHKYRYDSDKTFYAKLFNASGIDICIEK